MFQFYDAPITINFYPKFDGAVQQPLNVLVVGSDCTQFEETDQILQYGQAPYAELNVVVVNDQPGCKDQYLDNPGREQGDKPTRRKRLENFLTIDEPLSPGFPNGETSCGTLNFLECLNSDDQNYAERVFESVYKFNPDFTPHYIVVILSDIKRNQTIANLFAEKWSNAYVRYRTAEQRARASNDLANPYAVEQPTNYEERPEYAEFLRWAFNVHMIWNPRPTIGVDELLEEFLGISANFNSCISDAISIKTRLTALGIDFNQGWSKIADDARSALQDLNKREQICNAQHRRFIMHKALEGYTPYEITDAVSQRRDKDNQAQRHLCLKRASLDLDFASKRFYEMSAKDAKDDLERVNLRFYQEMANIANKIDRYQVLRRSVDKILPLLKSSARLVNYFRSLCISLQLVFAGEQDKVPYYKHTLDALKIAVANDGALPKKHRGRLSRYINVLEKKVSAIIQAEGVTNYRRNDYRIAKGLPFILTHSLGIHLFIPYSLKPEDALENVASATVINPTRITFLCLLQERSDVDKWVRSFEKTLNYVKYNRLTNRIRVFFILNWEAIQEKNEIQSLVEKGIKHINERHIEQRDLDPQFFDIDGFEENLEQIFANAQKQAQEDRSKAYFPKRSQLVAFPNDNQAALVRWQNFPQVQNDELLSLLRRKDSICRFTFDSLRGEFNNNSDFKHIPQRRYFGPVDLRVLKGVFPSYSFNFNPMDSRAHTLWDRVVSQEPMSKWIDFTRKLIEYNEAYLGVMTRELRENSEVSRRVDVIFKITDGGRTANPIETFLQGLDAHKFITDLEKQWLNDHSLRVSFYYANDRDKELILRPRDVLDAHIYRDTLKELQTPIDPVVNEVARNIRPSFNAESAVNNYDFVFFAGFRSIYINYYWLNETDSIVEYAREFKESVAKNGFNAIPALLAIGRNLTDDEIQQLNYINVKIIDFNNFAQRIRDILAADDEADAEILGEP